MGHVYLLCTVLYSVRTNMAREKHVGWRPSYRVCLWVQDPTRAVPT